MAGIFGFFDHTKPGKGVDADAPPKHPFFMFWELFFRKFSRMVTLNLLVFLFMVPIITFLYVQMYELFRSFAPELQELIGGHVTAGEEINFSLSLLQELLFSIVSPLPGVVFYLLLSVSVVLYGPMMCGFSYVLRNFARQEHAWLSDFFVQMKKNFVQGMIAGLLEISVAVLLLYNIFTPLGEGMPDSMGVFISVVKYISMVLFILVLFVHNYIYIMIVTFKMTLKNIIKNGWIFSVLGLFRNILITLVAAAFLLAVLLVPYADIILAPFLAFSFCGFLSVFAAYPLIHKHMIAPTLAAKDGEGDAVI